MRQFSRETQRNYIRDVGRFATFLGRSPATATADDVRRFQIEQRDAGVPTPTMNSIVSALRFLFTHTHRPARPGTQADPGGASTQPACGAEPGRGRCDCSTRPPASSTRRPCRSPMAPACASPRSPRSRLRHRQRAHADPGRARQGGPVSQCHAPGRSADLAARVVEGRAATGRDARTRLAVSGPDTR